MKRRLCVLLSIAVIVNLFSSIAVFAENQQPPYQLMVSGNKIVLADDASVEVRLAGINIPSLEWGNTGEHLYESLTEGCDGWNANIVRLPLSPARWFDETVSESYRAQVADMVKGVTARGKYIILDCHTYVMPTQEVYDFWMDVCDVYGNNPAVLFGLCNEPHDISGAENDAAKSQWELWHSGGMINYNGSVVRGYGHQELIEAIRDKGAKNILIAAGLSWGYDLSGVANGYALVDRSSDGDPSKTGYGIMYDSHIYPTKGLKDSWDRSAGCVRSFAPLLIGEFGWDSADGNISNDTSVYNLWMPDLLDWIDDTDGTYGVPANWTAWCFHPAATPRVITSWKYRPTYHLGEYVKERLLSYPDTRLYSDKVYQNSFSPDVFRGYSNMFNGSQKYVSSTAASGELKLELRRGADSDYVGQLMYLPVDWCLAGLQKVEFDLTADSSAVSTGMGIEVGFYGSDTELWTKKVDVSGTDKTHVTVYVNELTNLDPSVRADDSFTYGISALYIGAASEGNGAYTISDLKIHTAEEQTYPLPADYVREPNNPNYLIDNDYDATMMEVYKNDNGPGSSQGDYFRTTVEDGAGYNGTTGIHIEYNRINGIWGGYSGLYYPDGSDFSDAVYWSFMIRGNGEAQQATVKAPPASATIQLAEGDTSWHQYIFRFSQLGCMAPEEIWDMQFHADYKMESEFWVDNIQITKEYPTVFVEPEKVVFENGFEDTQVTVNLIQGGSGSTVTGKYADGGYNSQQAYMLSFNNTGTDSGAIAEMRNPSGWDISKTDTFTFDAKTTSGNTGSIRLGLMDRVGVAAYTGEDYLLTDEWQRFTVDIYDFKLNGVAIVNSRITGISIMSLSEGESTVLIDNISFSNYEVEPPVPYSAQYVNTFDPDVYGEYTSVNASDSGSITAEVTGGVGYEGTAGLKFTHTGNQGSTIAVDITDLPEEWDFSKVKYLSAMVRGCNPDANGGYQVNGSSFTLELYCDTDDGSGNITSVKTGSVALHADKDTWSNIITAIIPHTTNTAYIENTNRIRIYSNRSITDGGFIIDNLGFYDMKPDRVIPEEKAEFTETFDASYMLDLKFDGGYYTDENNYLYKSDTGGYSHWGLSFQSAHDGEGVPTPDSGTAYALASIPVSWELDRTTHMTFMCRLNQAWRTQNFSNVFAALPEGGLTETNITVALLDSEMNEYVQNLKITNKSWEEASLPLSGFVDGSGRQIDLTDAEYIKIYVDAEAGQSGFNMDNMSFVAKETGVKSISVFSGGEELTDELKSGTATVNAEMLSPGQSATLFAALYLGNELCLVRSSSSASANLSVDITIPEHPEDYTLKVFVWNKSNAKPYKNGCIWIP